jgi:hypothetical protein
MLQDILPVFIKPGYQIFYDPFLAPAPPLAAAPALEAHLFANYALPPFDNQLNRSVSVTR